MELVSEAFAERSSLRNRSIGLGIFSIGLGLTELLAPRALTRLIGVAESRGACSLLRGFGIREIVSGVMLLARPSSAASVWSRVAGDVIDLAMLGQALRSQGSNGKRVAGAAAAVLGVTAVDAVTAVQLS